MFRFSWAMIVGGGVLVFLAVQDMRLNATAQKEPQQITCAELEKNGAGDNAHIVLQDFLLTTSAFVYEEQSGGRWSKVWVPAVPLGGEYHRKVLSMLDEQGNLRGNLPTPAKVKVIVKSSKVANERELNQLADQDTLQGMVVNLISSLGSDEKKLLKESYPFVNFDDCHIVEVGRKPAGTGKLLGFGGGGAVLALLGVGLLVGSKRSA